MISDSQDAIGKTDPWVSWITLVALRTDVSLITLIAFQTLSSRVSRITLVALRTRISRITLVALRAFNRSQRDVSGDGIGRNTVDLSNVGETGRNRRDRNNIFVLNYLRRSQRKSKLNGSLLQSIDLLNCFVGPSR